MRGGKDAHVTVARPNVTNRSVVPMFEHTKEFDLLR